jgi:hypothetical protein
MASKAIPHGGQVNSYYDDRHDATGRFDRVQLFSLMYVGNTASSTYADAGIDPRERQEALRPVKQRLWTSIPC